MSLSHWRLRKILTAPSSGQALLCVFYTLYLLSHPRRSALLSPLLTEEEPEAKGISDLPKLSREAETHEGWG